ncbi:MAG: addiction module protein [Verrucomicrobia bacterium]|nr:addiction module protein [Verrucomicrobiota bacterium]
MSATEVIEQIRSLPADEKRELFEKIWDEFGNELGCVDDGLTPEQAAVLDRRVAAFNENPDAGIPLEQVRAEAKKRFGWK